jgi:DNA-binding CsgD family transcriptional regulator
MADATMTPRGKTVLRSLNRRERQILSLLCGGLSNRVIAQRVGLQEQVIKNYLRQVFKKAGVKNRQQLVVFSWQSGIVMCPCAARARFLKSTESADLTQQPVKVDARTTSSPQALVDRTESLQDSISNPAP